MTRLTNEIRDKIINNAITKAIGERETVQLKSFADKFSDELVKTALGDRLDSLTKIEKDIKKLIDKIPEEFRTYEDEYHVIDYDVVRLNIAGQAVDWGFDEPRIFPRNTWRDRYVIPQGHVLVGMMDDYRAEQKAISDIKTNVRENVRALVYSVTTVKKLLEVWPESLELIPSNVEKPIVQLPSIKIEQLNALIGVPTEK